MTSEELKEEIDLAITTETTPASITPTDVGDTLKLIVDYVDQEVEYLSIKKECCGFLNYDGTTFSYTSVINQLGSTISWVKFGGVIYGTFSTSVLTENKTFIEDRTVSTSGGYLVSCRRSNGTNFELSFTNTDGTNSSVPNLTNFPIKIEVYN